MARRYATALHATASERAGDHMTVRTIAKIADGGHKASEPIDVCEHAKRLYMNINLSNKHQTVSYDCNFIVPLDLPNFEWHAEHHYRTVEQSSMLRFKESTHNQYRHRIEYTVYCEMV